MARIGLKQLKKEQQKQQREGGEDNKRNVYDVNTFVSNNTNKL